MLQNVFRSATRFFQGVGKDWQVGEIVFAGDCLDQGLHSRGEPSLVENNGAEGEQAEDIS
jgi:hypothetical protein